MSFNYDAYRYYFDLLAFSLLLVPCYYALKGDKARRALLTLGGVYILYFVAPRLLLFYLVFWVGVFALQRLVALIGEKRGAGMVLAIAIIAALSPMLAWKWYGDAFNADFNLILNGWLKPLSYSLWEIDMSRSLLTPIGISFAAFRAVDLLIKTYIGKFGCLAFEKLMFYGFFAPVQVVGPISEYEETSGMPTGADPQMIYEGLLRVATGFIKIFAISTMLSGASVILTHPEELSVLQAWGMLFVYSWYFYLNFSGYADIAIGAARLYGFTLKENFHFPLLRPRNVQEYWQSWHMSLTRFAQRNIFIPLGGYRPKTQYLALFMTMMVIALWHGLNLSILFFGLAHAAGLIVHRLYARMTGENRKPGMVEATAYRILTYVFVSVIQPSVMAGSLGQTLQFYKALLGMP